MEMASVWLLVLVFFSETCNVLAEGDPERETLISFKKSLENPRVLFSWNGKTPHCNWVGVTCELGRVVSLSLPALFFKAPLSPSLFSLPSSVPSELGELTQLETLELGLNFFTGKIPPELGKLKQLKTLDISGNALTGTLPSQLGELTQLQFLDLGNNLLSGSLPVTLLTNLQSLTSLDVSNNSLSGSIPSEIGNLKNLTDLYLGPLPEELSKLKSLSKLGSFI
ncbi:hypothetical protein Patl1_07498 [Pistacia atlantica]|uniref:Uncharacterized protein n=1 Tax=Pistacia atlantica TaxID=434234 RepID=A0ACC1AIC8_9ROSI|nr:hypothetical protein Patl1_07498 [Pistacia atlantica]